MTDPHSYFKETTATLAPDVERLVSGGLTRGRVRRRRRQRLAAVGAGAAVAVLAVGAAVVPRWLEPSTAPVPPTAPGTGKAVEAPPAPRELGVTPAEAPQVVVGIVGGDVSAAQAFPADHGGVLAHFRWNGAFTTVVVDGFLDADRTPLQECRALAGRGMECVQGADGSVTSQWQQAQPTVDGGTTGRGSTLYTVDGWALTAISYNAADPKAAEQLAPEPPLTFDQLEQIVTSNAWWAAG